MGKVRAGVGYQGSSSDCETGKTLALDAVGCGQDCVCVHETAAAEVLPVLLERNDEGEVAGRSRDTANDGRCACIFVPLRHGVG